MTAHIRYRGFQGNIRYARNTVSTAGEVSNVTLAVQSSFGKQTGTATINEFDDASLEKVVRRYRETPSPLVRDAVRGWRTGRCDRVFDGDFDLFE